MLTKISLTNWISSQWASSPKCGWDPASRSPSWSQQVEDVCRGNFERGEGHDAVQDAKSSHAVYLENAAGIACLILEQVLALNELQRGTLDLSDITLTTEIRNQQPRGTADGGCAQVSSLVKCVSIAHNNNGTHQPPLFQSLAFVFTKLFTRQESLPGWDDILPQDDDDGLCNVDGGDDSAFESAMLNALSILDKEEGNQAPHLSKQRRHGAESSTFERTRSQCPSLPDHICRLIADLIDAPNRGGTSFVSLNDVRDDLEQMANEPGTFMHDPKVPQCKLDFGPGLHGRKKELSQLLDRVNIITSKRDNDMLEVVTVGGYSGSGKSSLVRQVGQYLSSHGWMFIQGKFDRMRQSDAFSVVTSALESYCQKIEAMKSQGLEGDLSYCSRVSTAVMGALGHAGVLYLNQIIPSLQSIVELDGSHEGSPSAQIQTADEAIMSHKRRELSLCAFVEAISSAGRPILLFYDDLHWADSSSVDFFQRLMKHLADRSAPTKSIIFALSFRENEKKETDPLHRLVSNLLTYKSINTTRIKLDGFSKEELNDTLSHVLRLPRRLTSPLSDAIYHKTTGNVFFVIEFTKTLQSPDKNLLTYSLSKRRWVWDADSIAIVTISESVAGLLVKKLISMEKSMLDSLIIAACFGSQVNTAVMKLLNGTKGVSNVAKNLDAAVDEGLLEKAGPLYMFSHDSIQQSVYELIPNSERLQLHVDIGLMLISKSGRAPGDMIEEIFSFAVSHINMALPSGINGESTIEFTPSQRIVFAKLNLKAGQKAANGKSDFSLAEVHLHAGIQFLNGLPLGESWSAQYELTLQIFDEFIYVLYVQRKIVELRSHINIILENAKCIEDKIRAHELLISVLTFGGSTHDAMDHATSVLDALGFPFPSSIDSNTIAGVFTSLNSTILAFTPDHLRAMPQMAEKVPLNAMKILSAVHMPFSFSNPNTYHMIACQMMQLTIKHGVCVESAEAFANYGYCLNALFRNYDAGYRMGQLSLVILDRFKATKRLAKVYFIVYGFVALWKEPIQATVEALLYAVKTGLSEGDYPTVLTIQTSINRQMFLAGSNLSILRDRLLSLCRDMMSSTFRGSHHPSFRAVVGDLYSLLDFTGESADEISSILGISRKENESLLWKQYDEAHNAPHAQIVYYHRLTKSFWFREYESVVECCAKYDSYTHASKVLRVSDVYREVLYGISMFILSRRKNDKELFSKGEECLTNMQAWAIVGSKWNAENKALLLEAECNFAKGDIPRAKTAYEQSIQSAKQHKFIHEEALANELYGIFCVEVGDLYKGNELLEKARDLYEEWGAKKKADMIFSL